MFRTPLEQALASATAVHKQCVTPSSSRTPQTASHSPSTRLPQQVDGASEEARHVAVVQRAVLQWGCDGGEAAAHSGLTATPAGAATAAQGAGRALLHSPA